MMVATRCDFVTIATFAMTRLVPSHCSMRPSQIQDLRQLADLDRRLDETRQPSQAKRWRNFAALAFLVFSLIVVFKDWRLMGLILLGLIPLYVLFGGLIWLNRHPAMQDWVNYWVVECEGKVVACAKWQHYDAFSELQGLYVLPRWRLQGLGSSLVERLIEQAPQPIYVLSDRRSVPFFQRFGFQIISSDALPANFPLPDFAIPELDMTPQDRQMPLCWQPRPAVAPRLDDFWVQAMAQVRHLEPEP
jgi:N-acetylglutamate synthase-like GNAT family acetyltransferase